MYRSFGYRYLSTYRRLCSNVNAFSLRSHTCGELRLTNEGKKSLLLKLLGLFRRDCGTLWMVGLQANEQILCTQRRIRNGSGHYSRRKYASI